MALPQTPMTAAEPSSRSLVRPDVVDNSDRELSLRETTRVLLQNWRIIALLAVIAPILAVVVVLATPRTFTSTASFYPESAGSSGGLSILAQQYGINLPGGAGSDAAQSLQFYVELARSREILSRLVTDSFSYRGPDGVVTKPLGDILRLSGESPAERVDEGVQALRQMIRPAANPATGIVRVDVTTRFPTVSQALAQRMIDLINEFNLQRRQSQGASKRRFAERRLAEMTDSLRAAEDRLQSFEQRNVQYLLSPQLRMEQRRLANNLAAKQVVQTALAQSYEQARIDEVRDTPVITTIERPTIPVRPDSRRGLQKMIFAFVVAVTLGIVYAFVRSNLGFFKSSLA